MAEVIFPIENVKVKKGEPITPKMLGIAPIVAENNVITLTTFKGKDQLVQEGNDYIYIGKDAQYSFSGEVYTTTSSFRHSIDRLIFQDGITNLGEFAVEDNAIYVQYEITYPEGYNGDLVKIGMINDRPSDYISGEDPYLWDNYIVKIVVPRSMTELDLSVAASNWQYGLNKYVRVSLDPHIYLKVDKVSEMPSISLPPQSTYGELYVNTNLFNDIKANYPEGYERDVHNVDTGEVFTRYNDPNTK